MRTPVDDLFEFLRFPSVSTDPAHQRDVAACAEWLVRKFHAMGLAAESHATPGHPIVVARSPAQPGKRTVLIYGHYDVQPVDPVSEWTHPPFEPVVVDGRIFARGSTDNKGQILAHILGVEATLQEGGELPVNVIFVVEGEEEIGSNHLEPFLKAHAAELACDAVAISDTGMIAPGYPTFTYGLRGITALEVRVKGPRTDLHSGNFGGAVANPATALARLVATLHDADGRVAVEGFYDDVALPADWEREAWAKLPVQDADYVELTGAPELFGEVGFTTLERLWSRPTVEVNGIGGGFQGEGSKTVIPREAFVKLTCRLVPYQDPEKIEKLVRAHLEKHTPRGVEVHVEGGHYAQPFLVDPMTPYGLAAQRALHRAFGKSPAMIREGGSIPITRVFTEVLNAPVLMLGLADPDCRAHAPDENLPVVNFENGIRLNQVLLEELAK